MRSARCFIIMLSAALLLSAGCGKKGPPVPPPLQFSAAVMDLKAQADPAGVLLEGAVYGRKVDTASVSGCTVYHVWYPPGKEPCENCPLGFRPLETAGSFVSGPDGFSCRVPLEEREGVHYFQVRLLGPGGNPGPLSPVAKIYKYQ